MESHKVKLSHYTGRSTDDSFVLLGNLRYAARFNSFSLTPYLQVALQPTSVWAPLFRELISIRLWAKSQYVDEVIKISKCWKWEKWAMSLRTEGV